MTSWCVRRPPRATRPARTAHPTSTLAMPNKAPASCRSCSMPSITHMHQAPVLAVAFSPDGQRAATGCRDLTAWLWDLSTRKPVGSPLSHGNQVVKVVFSPDGKWLATGSMDDTARLWDATTGRPVGRPMNHGQEISALAFSSDSGLLVSGSDDRSVRFWDRATGRPVGPALPQAYSVFDVAFAQDGQTVRSACASAAGDIEVTSTHVPVPKTRHPRNRPHLVRGGDRFRTRRDRRPAHPRRRRVARSSAATRRLNIDGSDQEKGVGSRFREMRENGLRFGS